VAALRDLVPVLKMLWSAGPWLVSSAILLRVAGAAVPVAMLAVSRSIVDAVTAAAAGHVPDPRLWWWVAAECGLAAAGAIVGRTVSSFETFVSERFSYSMSVRIMSHAASLDYRDYEDPAFQDRLERARAQATDRVRLVRAAGDLVQQVTLLLGYAASLFVFSPWLAMVLLASVVPLVVGESHFAFVGYTLSFRQTGRRRELDYVRMLVSSAQSAKEVRAFDLTAYLTRRFQSLWSGLYRENAALTTARWLWGSALSLVLVAGYYGCFVIVVWRAVHGDITVGTMTLLAGALAGTSSSFQNVCATVAGLADEALFVSDLVTFFNHAPSRARGTGRRVPSPLREGICFEDVCFQYPDASSPALHRLNLQIRRDERIALVGRNGQGKSTIVKLLMGLYEPTAGRILIDGVDLREYSAASIAEAIAPMFQDFMHYDMTAHDNIALGRIRDEGGAAHEDRVYQAAAGSLAAPVIERLPGRMDQMLGRRFDGGVDLSGGEWQKLALARAYLKNAQILILDEPPASLDPDSEERVLERLDTFAQGRIMVLVSHRFSTVRRAGRILVIDRGQILEEGNHEALVRRGGTYAMLFSRQAASYR